MADQRLRLIAELKNNASPGLKQISKDLKEITRTPGMEAATKWMVGFSEAASGFVKEGGGISSTMGAIGIGGLTAAASLAGLVEQFKKLGDHSFAMKRLGQEAKMTIAEISKWEYVGQVFRVPQEQMDAALKTFGEQMRLFAQRRGELFGKLADVDPEETKKLLGIKGANLQFQEILRYISGIKDAATQNDYMKAFFGTDDLRYLLSSGFPALKKAIEEAGKNAVVPTEEFQKQADLLNKSIVDFNAAWTNFEVSVGPTVFNQLRLAADDFGAVFKEITSDVDKVMAAIKPLMDWLDKEKGRTLPQMTGDAVRDSAAELKRSRDELSTFGNNGDAGLHGDERFPAGSPQAKGGGSWLGKLFGGSLQKSAYVTGLDGSPFGGDSSGLSDGVKEGVLAAFREWAAESSATKAAAGGGAKVQNAAYTTFGSDGGSGGGTGGGFGSLDGANLSGGDAKGEHAEYIRQLAAKYGIDPRVAVAVAKSEGLGAFSGDHGTSFGDFQLHYGGLADIFERQTGLKANDPANWKQSDDWALKYASKHGWHDWHGAARIGVTGMAGIGAAGLPSGGSPGSPGRAVDIAMGLLGAGSGQAAQALGSKMTPGEWCADFVNGAFKAAGMKGVNSSMARAFSAWGSAVGLNDVRKGDVILEQHGDHVGHVGLATGRVDKNGNVEMVSGNYGHAVRRNWEHPGEIAGLRRAIPSLVDEARKSSDPRPGANDGSIEAHVHIHDGQVRGASARSSGIVRSPQVHLRRRPMMTQPNIEA